ncbi:MAG: methyl-accepting chemotaxis protein [candidate division NC10 bacterium]|nr:methyl-accepting chemotaxis protein [candidate division NC10 bacterium]
MSRPPLWRRRFYVHPIQRKYLALSLIPLILCSVAMFFLAFLPLNLLVLNNPADFDAVVASSCLGLVGRRLWPAIFLSMLLVAGLSVLATHTVAGPLVRLERIGKRLAAGELPEAVRIREGDDLHEIAADLDAVVGTFRGAVLEIREQTGQARTHLQAVQAAPTSAEAAARLRELEAHLAGIEAALKAFRL